jgi:hypothetical protein
VLNADASRPNALWLFKGSDYFLYNLETGAIEDNRMNKPTVQLEGRE